MFRRVSSQFFVRQSNGYVRRTTSGGNVFPLVSNVNFWLLVGLSSGSISLVEK